MTYSRAATREKLRARKLQEPLGVEMADLLLVWWTERNAVQERAPLLVRGIRVINRENNALGPYHLQSEQEQRVGEERAGREVEILQKVFGYRALQILYHRRERVTDP